MKREILGRDILKRNIFVLIFLIILSACLSVRCYADDIDEGEGSSAVIQLEDIPALKNELPRIDATAAIVMDMESGRVLYEKNAHSQRAIASTTKILTSIIAIEKGNLEDIVTVSERAASIWGSKIKLKEGEKLKLKELLYGLMLNSGNDAAIAIAEHIAGSVENFADMMNSKAVEIGAKNSHFITPHGLDTPGQYSTAYDLALITRYALKNPVFAEIVKTKTSEIPGRSLHNTNEVLFSYPGADGVKTGYTGQAGRCLVASATKNNTKIITVVLNCATRAKRAQSTINLFEYAFNNYKKVTLIQQNRNIEVLPVDRGIEKWVNIKAAAEITMPLRTDEEEKLKMKLELPEMLEAPVKAGEEIGYAIFTIDDMELARTPLYIAESVRRKNFLDYLWDVFKSWLSIIK